MECKPVWLRFFPILIWPSSHYPVASACPNGLWLRSLAPLICSYLVDLRARFRDQAVTEMRPRVSCDDCGERRMRPHTPGNVNRLNFRSLPECYSMIGES